MRIAAVVFLILAALAVWLVRDGEQVTPSGSGTASLSGKEYEAFVLPDYAAKLLNATYKSYLIEVEPGIKVHMLETGQGYPVYMQHGNPTSGFLYRKVVDELPLDRVRVILPTLVGLGFSSKIPASEHTIENHVRWIHTALSALDLDGVIYVGQDWGGPVGMGAMALSPDLLKGVVAMNTGYTAPTQKQDLSRAHALVKTPLVGEFLIEVMSKRTNALQNVQGDPASIPEAVAELYKRPQLDDGNFKAQLAMMRMVPDGPDHPEAAQLRLVENFVRGLDVPAEIVWGLQDPILGAALPQMQALFPDARVTETQAGHFLQEEVPKDIAAAVMRLLEQVQSP